MEKKKGVEDEKKKMRQNKTMQTFLSFEND